MQLILKHCWQTHMLRGQDDHALVHWRSKYRLVGAIKAQARKQLPIWEASEHLPML